MSQPESSTVFTPEWIQMVEKRYGHRPRSLKSLPYLIATDRQFYPLFQQIEKWVAALPEAGREKMTPNLRSTDNFWHTCHELIVGSFLKELGLQVEFEKQFGKQTPDWFVVSKDGLHSFIVEVFTANVSESAEFENIQLDELTRRLGEIPLDFALRISCLENSAVRQLDSNRSKKIAEAVRKWLQANKRLSESSFSLDGFAFEIIQRNRGYATLQYATPAKPIYAAWTPLREKIERKVHKYRNLVLGNKIPLVVAVAPGSGTDYSIFEMKNILLGGVFNESPAKDGLFAREPLLSGGIFIERKGMAQWKIHHYPNPKATFPLPENIFEEGGCGE
jgi:hypothetical protein